MMADIVTGLDWLTEGSIDKELEVVLREGVAGGDEDLHKQCGRTGVKIT